MKFSQVNPNSSPALLDYLMGVTAGNLDFRVTLQNLITVMLKANYMYTPSKWSGYRSTAYSGVGAIVPMNVKNFDTSNNYDTTTGVFTAPESGYYFVNTQMTQASGGTAYMWTTIFKNGVEWRRGNRNSAGGGSGYGLWCSGLMYLVAGDQIGLGYASASSVVLETGPDNLKTVGEIFMVSKT